MEPREKRRSLLAFEIIAIVIIALLTLVAILL